MVEHVEHNEIEEFWRSVKEGLDKACKEHDATLGSSAAMSFG